MTTAPEADAGAMPDSTGSTETGAMPVDSGKPDAAVGATPPADGSGLEAALKRERDARKAAEAELKKLRPQATGSEALAARVAELEAQNAKAEHDAMRLRIAQETGLPSVLADRMHGDDETSLREDAEALKAVLPVIQPTGTTTTTSVGGPQGPPSGARSPEEWTQFLRSQR